MPLKFSASVEDRGLQTKIRKLSGRNVIQGAVREAAKDLRESVSVRSGRLRRSIRGKVTSPTSGFVQARFYVYPHLVKKTGMRQATEKIVFKGALRGARAALK